MPTQEDKMMTVRELAVYLQMKPVTVYKYTALGRLPGFKIGSHWRFKKNLIDTWMRSRQTGEVQKKEVLMA